MTAQNSFSTRGISAVMASFYPNPERKGGCAICVALGMLATIGTVPTVAEITPNLAVTKVAQLQGTEEEYVTYRALIIVSDADDWTSAQLTATLTGATFYQDPDNDGNPPDPAAFDAFPDSEATSYYTSPGDFPDAPFSGTVVAFNAGPTETDTSLSADWFDVVDTGDGDFVIAQITVLTGGSSSWTGQVDLTVFSVNSPGGVIDSFAISAADFEPPVTTTYIGPNPGTYNDGANWDVGVVPVNAGIDRFNVIILDGETVDFDIATCQSISGLSLGSDSTFAFDGGECLDVQSVAIVSGLIDATGAGTSFSATSQFASLGDNAQAFVAAGATVAIGDGDDHPGVLAYAWTNDFTDTTLFSVIDAGSLLDLRSLGSIDASAAGKCCSSFWYSIIASDGGIIDFSGLTSIVGAGDDEYLRFRAESNGEIDLTSLQQTSARVFFDPEIAFFSLPSLQSSSSALFEVSQSNTIDLPIVTVLDGCTLDLQDGGTIDAPLLTTFTDSEVTLTPDRFLTTGNLAQIDNSRIFLQAGANLDTVPVTDNDYFWTNDFNDTTVFSVDDAGTFLDLSSIELMDASAAGKCCSSFWYSIIASNGGTIDLSGLTTLVGAGDDEYLRFRPESNGEIDLSAVQQTSDRVFFDPEVAVFSLPALETASSSWFQVSIFNTIDLPVLTELDDGILDLEDGGTINAPNLTTFTDSTVTLKPNRFLLTPDFEEIDNSRILLEAGAVFDRVSDTEYFWTNDLSNTTLFSSDGTGTLLDLSSFQLFDASAASKCCSSFAYLIVATNGGAVDWTGLTTVVGAGSDEQLRFRAESGGSLAFGNVHFASGGSQLQADSPNSVITVSGNLTLTAPAQLSLTLAATLEVGGDLLFSTQNGDDFTTGEGALHMNGAGTQVLEVGGEDIGIPEGAISGNFEFGQLIVGQTEQANIVRLADDVDNGNRAVSGVEALYLQGFTGSENGLCLLGGSILVIENIQVYAQQDDDWVHINSLFPPGENQIAFNQGNCQGFISLSIVETDCNVNGIDDRVDILLGNSNDCNDNLLPDECEIDVSTPGGPFFCTENCDPDCNVNGIPDSCDIEAGTSQDCNQNGSPDDCDIAEGTSDDLNVNDIPDECEDCDNNGIQDFQDLIDCDGSPGCSDCNANGILDFCDINDGASDDVDGNGVPDECEADCNLNGVPDAHDIAAGTSLDCQPNNTPDECDLDPADPDGDGLVSNDVNGNGIPDECEPDCNANAIPDAWDISVGTSQDCQPNDVPDECDIDPADPDGDGQVSNDVNGNSTPDECEPDCNGNAVPDAWDIFIGNSQDCNENGQPDECDIAGGTSIDSDGNGVPDECQDCNENGVLDFLDIQNGTSQDCNSNLLPDECEIAFDLFEWIGSDGASFTDPANWDLGSVPGGDVLLSNDTAGDNRSILSAGGETTICSLAIDAGGDGDQILQINDDSSLASTNDTRLSVGGVVDLRGGGLAGAAVDNAGELIGYGTVTADVINSGLIEGSPGQTLTFSGSLFDNQETGILLAPIGSVVAVQSATVSQAGVVEISTQAAVAVTAALVNMDGGLISLLGGSIGTPALTNDPLGIIDGFGTIDADVSNDGEMFFIADSQIVGDLQNEGTITIQNGTLTITGDLSGSGTIIGDFSNALLPSGLTVIGGYAMGADGSLFLSAGTLKVAGDFDVGIDDFNRFDLTSSSLEFMGLPSGPAQTLEMLAEDVGQDVVLPDATLFSLDKLRFGPTATMAELVDNHDNSPGAGAEALYVNFLVFDPGVTLDLTGLRIYYVSVTPEDPFDLETGVTVIDSVGGGDLIPIGPLDTCEGDANGDGAVDPLDAGFVLARFGCPVGTGDAGCDAADVNGDGEVNPLDSGFVLARFGPCP